MKFKALSITFVFSAIVMLMLALAGCGKQATNEPVNTSYEVVDYQGTTVKFKEKPSRIMTVTMSTDNIVLGLVKPDKMVACNNLLDDPISSNIVELGKQIPNKIRHPKVEEILALQPDLVIAADWGNIDYVQSLRDMGINVVVVKGAKSLDDVRGNITMISAALGEKEKGEKLIAMMDEKLAALKAKTDKIPQDKRKKVALISLMNNYGGKNCIYDEACQWAGVRNGLAEAGLKRGDKLTKEMLVKIDADLIFLPSYTAHGTYDIQAFRDRYLKDPSLQQMRAIMNDGLRYPRDSYIYLASQDFVFAAQEIAYVTYGDEFKLDDQQHLSVAE